MNDQELNRRIEKLAEDIDRMHINMIRFYIAMTVQLLTVFIFLSLK